MTNVELLKEARRVIEAAPEDRVHMRTWYEEATCGTAYCLAGWCATDPAFRKNTNISGILRYDPTDESVIPCSYSMFEDLAELFGLSDYDAECLFGCGLSEYSDPHAVTKAEIIANIDRLIGGKHALRYAAYHEDMDGDALDDGEEYDDDEDA